ncbi:YueH family protein [Bacillus smithii]|uniref:YueH family protein n=1 Tax=Bacillus smithii TaxID=1479 RepID=UPI002E1FE9D9|nr:YueH family protein [Bacillus smithii]
MKIRKTEINGNETNIFIYENKKEDYFVVSIPEIEWSIFFTCEEEKEPLLRKMSDSLSKALSENESDEVAKRIYQWTREM